LLGIDLLGSQVQRPKKRMWFLNSKCAKDVEEARQDSRETMATLDDFKLSHMMMMAQAHAQAQAL